MSDISRARAMLLSPLTLELFNGDILRRDAMRYARRRQRGAWRAFYARFAAADDATDITTVLFTSFADIYSDATIFRRLLAAIRCYDFRLRQIFSMPGVTRMILFTLMLPYAIAVIQRRLLLLLMFHCRLFLLLLIHAIR